METEETIEDMMLNYNVSVNHELAKTELLERLLGEYIDMREQVRARLLI